MKKKYKAKVFMNFYLGSGDQAIHSRSRIVSAAKALGKSTSAYIMILLNIANPDLFKNER